MSDADDRSTVALEVRAPGVLDPWQSVTARVSIANTSSSVAILPVRLVLESAAGALGEWGVEAPMQRWGEIVPARVTTGTTEVVIVGRSQTGSAGAAGDLREVNAQYVSFEPLMPGAATEVEASFIATYGHGSRLNATLEYLALDPGERSICAVSGDAGAHGLAPCTRVSRIQPGPDNRLYMPVSELAASRRFARATTSLTVRRPAFDIDAARKRAGVMRGAFGYEPATSSWWLVDEDRRHSYRLTAEGEIDVLPGDWLELVLAVAAGGSTTLSWSVEARQEMQRIEAALSSVHIPSREYSFKEFVSNTSILLDIERHQLASLARILDEFKYSVDGLRIARQDRAAASPADPSSGEAK